jgi:phosphotransferase system  glucose/maltose/N-acetylglucosamine-specific IIC component
MFKMFLAGVFSFLSMIALTRINGTWEFPTFWFGLGCALVSFFVTKVWFMIFKAETSLFGKPKADGTQKSISSSTFTALFIALSAFLFSLLD